MIAYDCNGKVLNVGDRAIKIAVRYPMDFFLIGKSITIIGSLKYWNKEFTNYPGMCVEIKYHDGTVHSTRHSGLSISMPSFLMKITPDANVKEDEDQLVLVNR
jgi:hypothetical protein